MCSSLLVRCASKTRRQTLIIIVVKLAHPLVLHFVPSARMHISTFRRSDSTYFPFQHCRQRPKSGSLDYCGKTCRDAANRYSIHGGIISSHAFTQAQGVVGAPIPATNIPNYSPTFPPFSRMSTRFIAVVTRLMMCLHDSYANYLVASTCSTSCSQPNGFETDSATAW
jgi:hypothetical protein